MSDSQPASANRAVFLSYASQDAEAARRICEALRSGGVEVWFDADGGLEHGDEWDAKIRRQIKECVLFIPIISANTEARHEGYFRIEWELAAERAMGIASGVAFILPVLIDDTREPDALVPDRFRKVQWTRLPGGVVPPDVQQRFLKLWSHRAGQVSHVEKRAEAATGIAASLPASSPTPARSRPYALIAAVAVACVALAGWWWSRSDAPKPVPAAPPPKVAAEVMSTPPPATPEPTAPAVSEKSLVVLPLENLSPDPENAFFTDGMHAEIISTLQRVTDLRVIGRDSSLALKRGSASLAELARKVGVANVITGNVRRAGNKVRIQLELRRASDEALLWTSPNTERELKDVFELQSEIADDVARVLQAREAVGPNASARFLTKNPEAYDLFLRASKVYFSGPREGLEQAIPFLTAALTLDPDYANAAFMLSAAHANLVRLAAPDSRALHAGEAKRWALVAQRLAPRGVGAEAMAIYYASVEQDFTRALEQADTAIRALPNDSGPHTFRAWALCGLGRADEAVESFSAATKIDPLDPFCLWNDMMTFSILRRQDDATAAINRAVAGAFGTSNEKAIADDVARFRFMLTGQLPESYAGMDPLESARWLWRERRFAELEKVAASEYLKSGSDNVTRFAWRRWQHDALMRLGRTAETQEVSRDMVELARQLQALPDFGPSPKAGWLASALVRAGNADEAIAAGNRYVEAALPALHVAERWRRQIELAQIFSYLNRPRECVELLSKLLRVPSEITVPMLKVDPVWDNVREDSAFKALLADPKNSAPL